MAAPRRIPIPEKPHKALLGLDRDIGVIRDQRKELGRSAAAGDHGILRSMLATCERMTARLKILIDAEDDWGEGSDRTDASQNSERSTH